MMILKRFSRLVFNLETGSDVTLSCLAYGPEEAAERLAELAEETCRFPYDLKGKVFVDV